MCTTQPGWLGGHGSEVVRSAPAPFFHPSPVFRIIPPFLSPISLFCQSTVIFCPVPILSRPLSLPFRFSRSLFRFFSLFPPFSRSLPIPFTTPPFSLSSCPFPVIHFLLFSIFSFLFLFLCLFSFYPPPLYEPFSPVTPSIFACARDYRN